MPGNTLFSIGEALIDLIPSRVGCAFDEVPSFSPRSVSFCSLAVR